MNLCDSGCAGRFPGQIARRKREEAEARANGSIASVLEAAADYAVRKQAEEQARGQWIEQQEAAAAAFV
jgi:hypothetical protein